MQEIWKDIKGYEGLYQVSNLGNVRSLHYRKSNYSKLLIPQDDCRRGYLKVGFHKDGKYKTFSVHRLVASAFMTDKTSFKSMPCEDRNLIDLNSLVVNHKDEIKTNNNISNLEWCTERYNRYYGTNIVRQISKRYKPINQFDLNNNFIKRWNSTKEASEKLNIGRRNISDSLCSRNNRKSAGVYIWRYADK